MPSYYDFRSKYEDPIATALGHASIRWQAIEQQMKVVFSNATGIDPRTTSEMFSKIQTFSLKLELLDIVVRPKMLDDEWRETWKEIVAYVRELSGDRNFLVHNMLIHHIHAPGESTPKIGLSSAKRQACDEREIAELYDDFHVAWIDLLLIDSCVRNGQSSQDKHRGLKVRRRLSRTQRREADKRKPPRQRKPTPKSAPKE